MRVMLTSLVILMTLFALVRWLDKTMPAPAVTYEAVLVATAPDRVQWPESGGDVEQAAFTRFKALWMDLSDARLRELLPGVYAENIWFNDTVKTITNRADLLHYMLHTASLVKSTRVDVRDIARTDDGYYVRWVMRVEPANPRYGAVWQSIGMTHIRLNNEGEVILHQDYWDAAGGMFEHFPVLGWMIRNIKARL